MRKRLFAAICVLFLATGCLVSCSDPTQRSSSDDEKKETVSMKATGMYCFFGVPTMYDFWKSCGIDTLQFVSNEAGVALGAPLEACGAKWAADVKEAQAAGFRVYVAFLSNFWPDPSGDTGDAGGALGPGTSLFHPDNEEALAARLIRVKSIVQACSTADGFTIFCGDPGGITDDMGEGDAGDYIHLATEMVKAIREVDPDVPIHINPWSIAAFQTPRVSPFSTDFWLQETAAVRELLAQKELFGETVGVEFPCHDYYRGLALRCYAKSITLGEIDDFPRFPLSSDIDALKQQGVTDCWAWPYFLLDECDNGDGAGNGVQLETRYIHALMDELRAIGINGVFGNWSHAGTYTRALNTYAFGRFAADPAATPEQVIAEYAALNATAETADALAQVLRFVENDSHWHSTLPRKRQLPAFETSLTDVRDALVLLETVIARPDVPDHGFSLPEPPASYIARVRARLQAML